VSIKHRMRRALGVGLAGAMVLALMPAGIATADGHSEVCANVPDQDDFQDAASISATFREYVDCMQAYGIAAGFPDGTYRPGNPVTRQQMALFIARFISQAEDGDTTIPPTAPSTYSDRMDATPEARAAIDWLTQRGVVQGFADGTYRPGSNVTRAQMASFIAQAMEEVGADLDEGDGDNYPDVDDDATHSDNINKLTEAGVVRGFTDGTYRPGANVTRQQMAQFIILAAAELNEQGLWEGEFVEDETTPPATATARPELVSASIVQTTSQGTTVRYVFDEALTGTGAQVGGFHVYTFGYTGEATGEDGLGAPSGRYTASGAVQVESGNTRAALVTFPDVTSASAAATLSLATVDEFSVAGLEGMGTDGNIIGDAPLNPGTTTQLTSGRTSEPDLVSVGNFRANPANVNQTLVDFTFDAVAFNNSATTGGFDDNYYIISVDGVTEREGDVVAGNGTTVHTVAFENRVPTAGEQSTVTITAASIARGWVIGDTFARTLGGDANNPWQAANVTGSGTSETPDLVSAEIRRGVATAAGARDQILYTFDEPVLVTDPVGANSEFLAYASNGDLITTGSEATRSTTNDRQVLVTFGSAPNALELAVGAIVLPDAVREATGTQARPNLFDEVGVSNVGTGPTTVSGRTAAPDLTGVAVSRIENAFGTLVGARVVYTFDKDVYLVDGTRFGIALPDGSLYRCSGEATLTYVGTTQDTDNQVVCEFRGATPTITQALSAAVGYVDNAAVASQATPTLIGQAAGDGGQRNPEGSEVATR
jgi:hypothetical protein